MKQLLIIAAIMLVNAIIAAIAKKQQEAKKKAAAEAILRGGRPSPVRVQRELPDDPDEVFVNDDLFGDAGPTRLPPTSRTPQMQRPTPQQRPAPIPRPTLRSPLPTPDRGPTPRPQSNPIAPRTRVPRDRPAQQSTRHGFAERQAARAKASNLGARMRANKAARAQRETLRKAKQLARAKARQARSDRISGGAAAPRTYTTQQISPIATAVRAVLAKQETARTGFVIGEILGKPASTLA